MSNVAGLARDRPAILDAIRDDTILRPEGRLNACVKMPGSTLFHQEKAIQRENFLGRYSQVNRLSCREVQYSQAKMAPTAGPVFSLTVTINGMKIPRINQFGSFIPCLE
jgi:hypothetical protein